MKWNLPQPVTKPSLPPLRLFTGNSASFFRCGMGGSRWDTMDSVAREHSSGDRAGRRGAITKTGNAHLRRVIEAVWSYRRRPWIGGYLLRRQRNLKLSEEVKEMPVEGRVPPAQALYKTHSGRQKQKSNGDGSGPRTTRFHLGYCSENRTRLGAADGQSKRAGSSSVEEYPARKHNQSKHIKPGVLSVA